MQTLFVITTYLSEDDHDKNKIPSYLWIVYLIHLGPPAKIFIKIET